MYKLLIGTYNNIFIPWWRLWKTERFVISWDDVAFHRCLPVTEWFTTLGWCHSTSLSIPQPHGRGVFRTAVHMIRCPTWTQWMHWFLRISSENCQGWIRHAQRFFQKVWWSMRTYFSFTLLLCANMANKWSLLKHIAAFLIHFCFFVVVESWSVQKK